MFKRLSKVQKRKYKFLKETFYETVNNAVKEYLSKSAEHNLRPIEGTCLRDNIALLDIVVYVSASQSKLPMSGGIFFEEMLAKINAAIEAYKNYSTALDLPVFERHWIDNIELKIQ